jgi:hypothetical protein
MRESFKSPAFPKSRASWFGAAFAVAAGRKRLLTKEWDDRKMILGE